MSKRKNRSYKRGGQFRSAALYVIACEGERTEKIYFEQFCREFRRVQVVVLPTGEDHKSAPIHVLNRADEYVEELGVLGEDDKIWIVIDKDRWKEAQLNEVARKCEQKDKFQLILSNPCFEVWLYLHLKNPSVELKDIDKCKEFKTILRNDLGSYNPSNLNFSQFEPFTEIALEKAKTLDINPEHRFPNNKATRIYILIDELLKLKK